MIYVLAVLVFLAIVIVAKSITIIPQSSTKIIERLGRRVPRTHEFRAHFRHSLPCHLHAARTHRHLAAVFQLPQGSRTCQSR